VCAYAPASMTYISARVLVRQILVRHFPVPHFLSIDVSLVRHFPVLHFQSPSSYIRVKYSWA